MEYDYFTINFFPIMGVAFLTIFLWRNSYLEKNVRQTFYFLSGLVLVELCIYNSELLLASSYVNLHYILTFVSALGYSIRPLSLYFLITLVLRNESLAKVKIPLLVPFIINIFFAFSSFFTPLTFYYDSHNVYHRGMFGWTTHIVMLIYLVAMVFMSFAHYENKHKFERIIIIEMTIILIIGAFAESLFGSYAVLRYSEILSLIFYYMFFQSEMYKDEIVEKHIEQTNMTENFTLQMVAVLAKTVDAKDSYTNGHSQRVAEYSKEIASRLNKDAAFQRKIYYMGLLHDIGKIGIPDTIINKTSKLNDEEFAIIKSHPEIGAQVLKDITEMPTLYFGARWHHERYDGSGYPDHLVGDEIPFEARIIAVADVYDAMTSKRSYRDVLPQDVVKLEMEKAKRSQLDPYIVNIMLEMISADTSYEMREK